MYQYKMNMNLVSETKLRLFKKHLRELEEKLAVLTKSKARIAEDCGDLWHDNPMFEETERQQKLYEIQISNLRQEIRQAKVIKEKGGGAKKSKIGIGSKIKIEYPNGKIIKFEIVGHGESDKESGKLAYDTPLGKALLGKKSGDLAIFCIGDKEIEIKIIII